MVSVKMQISEILFISFNEKKTNNMLTIKLLFYYYTVTLIECMIIFTIGECAWKKISIPKEFRMRS